jgi:hypothetical protein
MRKTTKIFEELDSIIGPDCPACGYGLPGPHHKNCKVVKAFKRADGLSDFAKDVLKQTVRALSSKGKYKLELGRFYTRPSHKEEPTWVERLVGGRAK